MPEPIRAEKIIGNFTSVENWREVGTPGEPVFEDSWVNYDSEVHESASFYKDPFGVVHLKGLVKSGTIPGTVFTLPEGYRPSKAVLVSTISNSLVSQLQIGTDGVVKIQVGSNVWVSLNNISFRTV